MNWKTAVGTASVLVTAAGGCWWAVSASASPPTPVIGPTLVVTPASGGAATRPATPVVPTEEGESPEVVDPRWVRPVDDDGPQSTKADGDRSARHTR